MYPGLLPSGELLGVCFVMLTVLASRFCYLIFQLLPQVWHSAIRSFLNLWREPPLDFFHTRLDIPRVEIAIIPRIALLVFPPKPVPLWLDFPLVWTKSMRTLSEWHLGQFMVILLSERVWSEGGRS